MLRDCGIFCVSSLIFSCMLMIFHNALYLVNLDKNMFEPVAMCEEII